MLTAVQSRLLLILNVMGVGVFALVALRIGFNPNETMFLTPDSNNYRLVAEWLFGGNDTQLTLLRPVLYPFLLGTGRALGGNMGIWVMHILFWFGTINFTYLAIRKLTGKHLIAFAAAAFIMANLSLIALTFHGLTEVTATFMMSVFTWYMVRNYKFYLAPKMLIAAVLLLSLLTLVKPVFYPLYLLALLLVFPLYYLSTFLKQKRNLLWLFLAASPVLLQMTLLKFKHGEFTVSKIGDAAITNYYLPKAYAQMNDVSIEAARESTEHFKTTDHLAYIFQNPAVFYDVVKSNLKRSIKGEPVFLKYPTRWKNPVMVQRMRELNGIYFALHHIFPWLMVLMSIHFWRTDKQKLALILALTVPFVWILLSSGLSFYQGDRLPLPALPVWTTLYAWTLFEVYTFVSDRLRTRYFAKNPQKIA